MTALRLSPWQLVALLGALQGFVLSLALLRARSSRRANRLLAVAVLGFSLHLLTFIYYTAGLVESAPHFFGVTHPLPFLFGPLIYLYARLASDPTRRLRPVDLWHFAPALLAYLAAIPVFALSGPEKVDLFHAIVRGEEPAYITVAEDLKLLSGLGYSIATLWVLRSHEKVMAENYSTLERVSLSWLRRLARWATGIWLVAIAFEVAGLVGIPTPALGDQLVAVSITLLIYGVGYFGLRQQEIHRFDTEELPVPGAVPEPAALPGTDAEPAARYERSGLSSREAEQLTARLTALMGGEQPFHDPELTLADLAGRLGTSPHKLSEILNGRLATSFYDYVNGYRVREVQARLAGPDAGNRKLLSLALDAGFASKSTFNAAFKKLTGQTPSEFRSTSPSGE